MKIKISKKFFKYILAKFKPEEKDFIQSLKRRKLLCNKKLQEKSYICVEDTMSVKNNLFFYQIAHIFHLTNLSKKCYSYAERCFAEVAETRNFQQLDLALVLKILNSSSLHVTTELEVFNAANDWISCNRKERSEFCKDLLRAVRLPLLSAAALNSLLREASFVTANYECRLTVERVLGKNKSRFTELPSKSFRTRHCHHKQFDISVVEESRGVRSLKRMNGENLELVRASMFEEAEGEDGFVHQVVYLKGEFYAFVHTHTPFFDLIQIVKASRDAARCGPGFRARDGFGVCSLMDAIYVVGGVDGSSFCDYCVRYDTNSGEIKDFRVMNTARRSVGCCVFGGKIVVSGGFCYVGGVRYVGEYPTSTVEAYDHVAGDWTMMASMVRPRANHGQVAVKDKLFVVDKLMCEVFDRTAGKFALLKVTSQIGTLAIFPYEKIEAISIGNKVAVFGRKSSTVVLYDAGNHEWREESREFLNTCYTCCFKTPQK